MTFATFIQDFDTATGEHEKRVIRASNELDKAIRSIQYEFNANRKRRELDNTRYEIRAFLEAIQYDALHASGVACISWGDSWRNRKHGSDISSHAHIVFIEDFDNGKIQRKAGQTLCTPKARWGMTLAAGKQEPTCPRCTEMAQRHLTTKIDKQEKRTMELTPELLIDIKRFLKPDSTNFRLLHKGHEITFTVGDLLATIEAQAAEIARLREIAERRNVTNEQLTEEVRVTADSKQGRIEQLQDRLIEVSQERNDLAKERDTLRAALTEIASGSRQKANHTYTPISREYMQKRAKEALATTPKPTGDVDEPPAEPVREASLRVRVLRALLNRREAKPYSAIVSSVGNQACFVELRGLIGDGLITTRGEKYLITAAGRQWLEANGG